MKFNTKKETVISFWADREMADNLNLLAKSYKTPKSEVVRTILKNGIKRAIKLLPQDVAPASPPSASTVYVRIA